MDLKGVINELTEFYYKYEWWHKNKLNRKETEAYFTRLLGRGNIITHHIDNRLVGYVEFWRLSFSQWGKIVCHVPFCAYKEDVLSGNVCYVANTFILPEYRRTDVYKVLRRKFFEANRDCEYFVGNALRKKTQPIKVLTRDKALAKYGG